MARSIVAGGKLKSRRYRKKCIVIPGDGDPCPRCGNPMQIREYAGLDEKEERRPSFYTVAVQAAGRVLCLANLGRIASPIRPDLIFRQAHGSPGIWHPP